MPAPSTRDPEANVTTEGMIRDALYHTALFSILADGGVFRLRDGAEEDLTEELYAAVRHIAQQSATAVRELAAAEIVANPAADTWRDKAVLRLVSINALANAVDTGGRFHWSDEMRPVMTPPLYELVTSLHAAIREYRDLVRAALDAATPNAA